MSHYFENDNNLISEIKELKYKYDSFSFCLLTDNGVFSKSRLDFGSKLLLETYLEAEKESKKVLDVGCGYGFIGIVISVVTKSNVDMVDINKRALHLAKRNTKKLSDYNGKIFESDAYDNVTDKYDVIITNPPIRVGKTKVLEILNNASEHLNENGALYYVIRKDQGALSINRVLEEKYKIEMLNKCKGYFIYKASVLNKNK